MSTEEESTPVLDAQDEQLLKRIAHHHAPRAPKGGRSYAMMATDGLGVSYSGLRAIGEVNLSFAANEVTALIGPPGAGSRPCCGA